MSNDLVTTISKFRDQDWFEAVNALLPSMHPVDRLAAQIWLRMYSIDLLNFLEDSENLEAAAHGIALQGTFGLRDKIDISHQFFYGHRYWPHVRSELLLLCQRSEQIETLERTIISLAEKVANAANTTRDLTLAISMAGLMTLAQVGEDELKNSAGTVAKPAGIWEKTPDAIEAARKTDDSQGVLGFLKSIDKKFTIHFDALRSSGKFPIITNEEIASASQKDRERDWQSMDDRCWEGPVPIECTSASCGTCWIGVIGGKEKLTPPSARERRQMKVFGYGQTDEEHPFIRLACQAKASGNVSIIIPPWNAVFGKKVRGNVEEVELEPNTTSAAKLRETISSAIENK